MIIYSARALNETMVVGTKDELYLLIEKLVSGCGEISCDLLQQEERANTESLKAIRITERARSKLDIQILEGVVVISGAPEYLKVLAENIRILASEGRGAAHWHCDYYPGHPFLLETARQLIFELA